MAVSINTNVNALGAIRRLAEASSRRLESFERLSSGLRINRASDDAAGLSVASTLNAKGRVHTQALRNLNDGISYLNVADGATSELKSVLFRLRELATQASNGSFSNTQRKSLDKETQALRAEYNRIIDATKFNGVSVFKNETLVVQAGIGTEAVLTIGLQRTVLIGDGTFRANTSFVAGTNPYSVSVADLNGDGVMDLVTADYGGGTASVLLGNGDGTFQARRSFVSGGAPVSIAVADLDGDGVTDLVSADIGTETASVLLGNGDGTFRASRSFATGINPRSVSVADFNGDGILDLVSADATDRTLSVLLGNGNGTFKARMSYLVGGGVLYAHTVSDFDGDGKLDLVAGGVSSEAFVLLGNGDGTFKARASFTVGAVSGSFATSDLDGDGVADLVVSTGFGSTVRVLMGNGDGTFQAMRLFEAGIPSRTVSVADLDGDGVADMALSGSDGTVRVLMGNGDGTFWANTSFVAGTNPYSVSVADLNGDGVMDLVTADYGGGTASVLLGNGVATARSSLTLLSGVNVATRGAALAAQGRIDDYLDEVNLVSGAIGSALSRFAHVARLIESTVEVTKAAEGRIRDVDVAEESARLVSTGILQEAASAVLAHALKGPELALTLLKT